MDEVTVLWEALTPPDRTNVVYKEVAGKTQSETAGDRRFEWNIPTRLGPVIEGPNEASAEYECSAVLRLSSGGRSPKTLRDAAIKEARLFQREVETQTSWTDSNIIEPVPLQWEVELDEEQVL